MKTITIFVTIIIIFSVTPVYPVVFFNYLCQNLEPGCPDESNSTTQEVTTETENLAYLQVQAANAFLMAQGNWNEFMVKVEMMDYTRQFDYIELTNILETTILKVNEAENFFAKIADASRNHQVKPIVMEKLNEFDYKWFCAEHSLNPDIMSEIECELNTGDILGIPDKFREKLVDIKILMESFRQGVEKKNIDIEKMYSINNEMLSMALFGQYTAMIFREVRLK